MTRRHPQPTRKPPSHAPKRKLSVAIIGGGRVGTALAIALSRNGYVIKLIVTKHKRNARRAAKLVGQEAKGVSLRELHNPENRALLAQSSLLLITTPDDVIAEAAVQLAALFDKKSRAVALHSSGALTSTELDPLNACGFATGSLHPLISISDPLAGADALQHGYFSVEGAAKAVRLGKRIARDLGSAAFEITAQDKALYHAAALMASPNLTALEDVAIEMLGRCGLTADKAQRVLLPLIQSTVDNLWHESPTQALTGTFKRRDVTTVKKHLAAMSAAKLYDALAAYIILGQRSLKLATSTSDARTREIGRLLSAAKKELPRT